MTPISRAHVRRWIARASIGVGAAALLAGAVSALTHFTLRVGNGSVALGHGAIAWRWAPGPATQAGKRVPPPPYLFSETVGWWWIPRWSGRPADGEFILPLWIPIALGALALYYALPAGPPAGHCRKCRFDLAGAPEVKVEHLHVRCPECGSIAALDRATPPSAPAQSH